MHSNSPNLSEPLSHAEFMRLFLQSEREILRYVMVLVPNVEDARDIVQETAVALWKVIAKYDRQRPFVPWACRFALNEARMFIRAESRRCRFVDEDVADLLAERAVEVAAELDDRREYLRDCLARLGDGQRDLIRGYYFEGESVDVLATRFKRGSEAVYKTIQRIRDVLHECIDRKTQAQN